VTVWFQVNTVRMKDKYGRVRDHFELKCDSCGDIFFKVAKDVKTEKHFCSVVCSGKYKSDINNVSLTCACCGKTFERSKGRLKGSRHGLYFCSRKCKDTAQSLDFDGCEEMQPPHYGLGKGINTYRDKAHNYYGLKCEICGYDECVRVLQVHHIDGNRENNAIENLIVLCPNHHAMITYGICSLIERKLVNI